MQLERREIERASSDGRRGPAKRLIKLPGEKRHANRSETAKDIARKIALDKIDKQIKALKQDA
ncbi:hypothetical protein EN858_21775 [Mesorhizobium sp. M4B.F.Ca.ET.215.01.1.1]|uniref:hypothetical protein n=1 Tax=unclassified Mesorhizobium TaxID=325217 RepID=UPI000FCBFCE5|nr:MULTISPECIES: hypothetical protein [unclassified Mesorhizobium]RVD40392.1 hypothetical protein EN741_16805 [Mesorhizobium sp. M4B.F.Ca.ET.019.03.1.1]TGQ08366.1 hypothetical protein EN858_21775 [Mesorhizobium sp. M4B.F.Ca.ET.215.01.1.1]TGQ41057.1 hypothetical protein EN863_021830 [Mesorhizobium sp. M00.F.Ca.ET.220.01.1.1]TGR01923.1 hypothetical protein EN846_18635 [Mesorhizobium sp. M4B.F.Ca.ET.203.01.1.1]TGT45392.1 hypothetical protein EN812_09645 [Mesorhizobium sp. M4B.F.Ca.ET.169.01.1.1]